MICASLVTTRSLARHPWSFHEYDVYSQDPESLLTQFLLSLSPGFRRRAPASSLMPPFSRPEWHGIPANFFSGLPFNSLRPAARLHFYYPQTLGETLGRASLFFPRNQGVLRIAQSLSGGG